jgi:hypothetical protein
MTVLGAVVFGGFLVLAVVWLLITAPDGDVDEARGRHQWSDRTDSGVQVSSSWALTHSSQQ